LRARGTSACSQRGQINSRQGQECTPFAGEILDRFSVKGNGFNGLRISAKPQVVFKPEPF
jgi:hypothetical protein